MASILPPSVLTSLEYFSNPDNIHNEHNGDLFMMHYVNLQHGFMGELSSAGLAAVETALQAHGYRVVFCARPSGSKMAFVTVKSNETFIVE